MFTTTAASTLGLVPSNWQLINLQVPGRALLLDGQIVTKQLMLNKHQICPGTAQAGTLLCAACPILMESFAGF